MGPSGKGVAGTDRKYVQFVQTRLTAPVPADQQANEQIDNEHCTDHGAQGATATTTEAIAESVRTANTSVEFHLAPPLHAPRQAYHLDRGSTAVHRGPLDQHRRCRRTLTGVTPDIVPGNSNPTSQPKNMVAKRAWHSRRKAVS